MNTFATQIRLTPTPMALQTRPLSPFVRPLLAVVLLLEAGLLLTSCGRKYRVEGSSTVTTLDGKTLYLRTLDNGKWVSVDSAEVEHGLFRMMGQVDSVVMVTLCMGEEGIMPLILESGRLQVTLSNDVLEAHGTPLNDALYSFIDKRTELADRMEELERREARLVLEGKNFDDIHAELETEMTSLSEEINSYVKNFIQANYENILGPGVFMMVCSTLPYPVMTPEIEAIIDSAPTTFRDNAFVKDYLAKARENMQLLQAQQENALTARN